MQPGRQYTRARSAFRRMISAAAAAGGKRRKGAEDGTAMGAASLPEIEHLLIPHVDAGGSCDGEQPSPASMVLR